MQLMRSEQIFPTVPRQRRELLYLSVNNNTLGTLLTCPIVMESAVLKRTHSACGLPAISCSINFSIDTPEARPLTPDGGRTASPVA